MFAEHKKNGGINRNSKCILFGLSISCKQLLARGGIIQYFTSQNETKMLLIGRRCEKISYVEKIDSPFDSVAIMEKLGKKLPKFTFDDKIEIIFINSRC